MAEKESTAVDNTKAGVGYLIVSIPLYFCAKMGYAVNKFMEHRRIHT